MIYTPSGDFNPPTHYSIYMNIVLTGTRSFQPPMPSDLFITIIVLYLESALDSVGAQLS